MQVMRSAGPMGVAAGPTTASLAKMPVSAENGRNYDQVEIVSENSFQKQLLGKLSQEVRAATTTGTVAALRREVQAGNYQIDPYAIARKLLFVWEA